MFRLLTVDIVFILLAVTSVYAQVYSYYDPHRKAMVYDYVPRPSTPDHSGQALAKLIAKQPQSTVETLNAISAPSSNYDDLIPKYAHKNGVDPQLVKAIMKVESNFNPRAVSRKGAKGLMQLMPERAADYGVKHIFDPEENIRGGVEYLRDLLALFDNNVALSVAAYNAGEKAVWRANGIPPYRETQDYVKKIRKLYGKDIHVYETASYTSAQEPVRYYRYIDENGVLHLTNIGPPPPNVKLLTE